MKLLWGLGVLLAISGCGTSSDSGAAAGGGGTGNGTAGAGLAGSGGGLSSGTSGSGGAHTAIGGAATADYGKYGAPGTSTISCGTTACANQICCETMAGFKKDCVDTFDQCAAEYDGVVPTAYGCTDPSQCPGGGHCCGHLNPDIYPEYTATSCKPSCDDTSEMELCQTDSDCSVMGELCSHGPDVNTCF